MGSFQLSEKFRPDVTLENSLLERWFLKPRVKILIVADQGISLDGAGFGLREAIDTMLSPTRHYHNWVRFRITGGTREGIGSVGAGREYSGITSPYQFKYTGFRFDMAGFDINQYDQVWFFGFRPGNDANPSDASVNNPANFPLSDNELKILSKWMNEQKGGVFATGDHHYLGASMCSRIPRVRNMRRWTNAQGVPPIGGFNRHDTNQPASYVGTIPFDAQNDTTPQPTEVLKKVYHGGFLKKNFVPHPVLCGVDGVINILPDHPHEGETLGKRFDGAAGGIPVDTSQTLNYAGFSFAEYPNGVNGGVKPEPVIIALGHPVNNPLHDKNQRPENPSHANDTTPFGLVSTYDGELAGIGRVLVDSTWHHWFNTNLTGLEAGNAVAYSKIQNYYLNVAVWLSRDTLRSQMLTAASWSLLVIEYDPMRFSVKDTIWSLGTYARDVLGRKASRCTTTEWVFDLFLPALRERFILVDDSPCLTCPPFEIFEVAILGGILKEMLPIVEKHRLVEKFERKNLATKEIEEATFRGISNSLAVLNENFKKSIENTRTLMADYPKLTRVLYAKQFKAAISQVGMAFSIDRIFITDPLLRHILTDQSRLTFVLTANGLEIGSYRLERFKIESLSSQDVVVHVGQTLFKNVFDEGEVVQLALYVEEITSENNVWTMIFEGDPASWIGAYSPGLKTGATVGVWMKVE